MSGSDATASMMKPGASLNVFSASCTLSTGGGGNLKTSSGFSGPPPARFLIGAPEIPDVLFVDSEPGVAADFGGGAALGAGASFFFESGDCPDSAGFAV